PAPPAPFVVLAADRGGAGAAALATYARGDAVAVGISYGLRNVLDLAGGEPLLVSRGAARTDPSCDTDYCGPNPRTAAGYTSDGRLLIVTVDGRQAGFSVGMGLDDLAHLLLQLGAEGAVNLDGGGSTTMWVEGRGVVNRPSNAGNAERPVGTALVILPGEDADMPTSLQG
ncbi:MAG: phosphodiester glycosidase family protein, partial [Actinomycetota bacterium]